MESQSRSLAKTKAGCFVITTAHKEYDLKWLVAHSQLVVDTRNAPSQVSDGSARVVILGPA